MFTRAAFSTPSSPTSVRVIYTLQNIGRAGDMTDRPMEIDHSIHQCFSYPSSAIASKDDESVNGDHYKPTSDRL